MSAQPVQIVDASGDEDHSFVLNDSALSEILMKNNVKDRSIVIISVAGAFRKGKSFILDFFLRYLYSKYVHKTDGDWLGNDDEPLVGFSWRGGCERDTTGIWMWSEIFLHDLPNGEKIAIALMDTQGAFDSQSTVKECATIFALSTMLSSVLIFNISQNIQEDDLQHLQLFTEYGRLALADSGKKPFQRLQFLVRDWSFPYDAEYGYTGGSKILKNRLEINDKQHPELQSIRRHIFSCFDEVSCFLMPHPGLDVATNPKFDGRLSEIHPAFRSALLELIPQLLAPENLIVKRINGQTVKARDLAQYFISYMQIYKGNELPEPKTMLVATAEANNLTAVAAAKEMYMQLMEDVCGGHRPYMNVNRLEVEHYRIKDKSIESFRSKRKMGGEDFSEKYREQLDSELEDAYGNFKAHNESKNIFTAARTPTTYFIILIIAYVLNGIFGLFGLTVFGNFTALVMGIALGVLVLWSYIKYSGELHEIGVTIDDFASFIWGTLFNPVWEILCSRSVQYVAANPEIFSQTLTGSSNTGRTINGKVKSS